MLKEYGGPPDCTERADVGVKTPLAHGKAALIDVVVCAPTIDDCRGENLNRYEEKKRLHYHKWLGGAIATVCVFPTAICAVSGAWGAGTHLFLETASKTRAARAPPMEATSLRWAFQTSWGARLANTSICARLHYLNTCLVTCISKIPSRFGFGGYSARPQRARQTASRDTAGCMTGPTPGEPASDGLAGGGL